MRYTLITADGKVMLFYVLGCAMLYQSINGGVIIDEAILNPEALDKAEAMV